MARFQQIICDICQKPIDSPFHGALARTKMKKVFLAHQPEEGIETEAYDVCDGCANIIFDFIKDIKRNHKESKNESGGKDKVPRK